MKLATTSIKQAGSTFAELMVGLSLSSVIAAAALTASVGLQKSFNAVDSYFATHMQQVRIIDYMSRDVQRGLAVTTSVDLQSVTVTVPNYLIKAGDPEAVVDPGLIGTPRSPTVSYTSSGPQVDYSSSSSTVVYQVNGTAIVRIENGQLTTIAASTDQLVPKTTDVELANTEYTNSTVTFRPIFTSSGVSADGSGTTICSTAYLRNKRRG